MMTCNEKVKKTLYVLGVTLILDLCPQTIPTSYASELSGGGLYNGVWHPYDNDMSQGASEDRSSHMMDKTIEQQRAEAAQKKAEEQARRQEEINRQQAQQQNANRNFQGPDNPKNLTNAGKNIANNNNPVGRVLLTATPSTPIPTYSSDMGSILLSSNSNVPAMSLEEKEAMAKAMDKETVGGIFASTANKVKVVVAIALLVIAIRCHLRKPYEQ